VCVNMNVLARVRVVVVSMLHNLRSLILRLNKIQALKSTNLVGLKLTKIKIHETKY
jgi:hypothetical protein